jgi:hypothetical protein
MNFFRQLFQLSIWLGCLILISVQDLAAQSKPLQEVYRNNCLPTPDPTHPYEIFKKIMDPPVLKTYSRDEFVHKIQQIIEKDHPESVKELYLNITVLVLLNRNICVADIKSSTPISEKLITELKNFVESVREFSYGKQLSVDQHSMGDCNIWLKNGKVRSLEWNNVEFEK